MSDAQADQDHPASDEHQRHASYGRKPPRTVRTGETMLFLGAGFFLLIFGFGRFFAAVVMDWEGGSPGARSMLGFVHPEVAGPVNIAVLGLVIGLAMAARRGRAAARLALTIVAAPALFWELGRFFGPALVWPVFEPTRDYQQLAAGSPAVHIPEPAWAITPIVVMTVYTTIAIALFWNASANAWYRKMRES